jgi:aryl-alcohol dehydrogenase-like predicted oxidoreductase
MGLLTGKYTRTSVIPKDDIRAGWNLQNGYQTKQFEMLDMIYEILTRDGRTLVQAALG